ncbi:MAG: NAD(+)/NADH kinase [Bacteroidetes bacterium]|nr:NAD(+)/NADH kinase [Bacteroidota bacterium]
MAIEYAIIIKNKTRLELLVERFNTVAQARFYIEHSGGDFSDYEAEHEMFHQSLSSMQRQLSNIIKNKIVDRVFLPSFLFNDKQVVIVVGQDGLVANTAKYVNNIPIIAVNPDEKRYDGVLLPFKPTNFLPQVEKVIAKTHTTKSVILAEARLNDGQRLLAFNDLFIGVNSHVSARYKILYNKNNEEHSSSGIIVSTPSGTTGWLSSIFNMIYSIGNMIEKNSAKRMQPKLKNEQLMFIVREPFLSKKTQINVCGGIINKAQELVLESLMPSNGIIFSDGVEADFLNFNAGTIVTIGVAKEKVQLVIA